MEEEDGHDKENEVHSRQTAEDTNLSVGHTGFYQRFIGDGERIRSASGCVGDYGSCEVTGKQMDSDGHERFWD